MPPSVIVLIVVLVVLLFSMLLVVLARYRRCPSDKVLVIYGRVGMQHQTAAAGRPSVSTAARRSSGRWSRPTPIWT